jgi:hypothetical protein
MMISGREAAGLGETTAVKDEHCDSSSRLIRHTNHTSTSDESRDQKSITAKKDACYSPAC